MQAFSNFPHTFTAGFDHKHLCNFVALIRASRESVLDPEPVVAFVCKELKLDMTRQQDASELVQHLVQHTNESMIHIKYETQRKSCCHVTSVEERTPVLWLPIVIAKNSTSFESLSRCLVAFQSQGETVSEVKCDFSGCMCIGMATRKMSISGSSNILVLMLKRFSARRKISTKLQIDRSIEVAGRLYCIKPIQILVTYLWITKS